MKRNALFITTLLLLAISSGFFLRDGDSAQYRTELVVRETITSSISATGTLEPEEVIDVGAQVAGMIVEFGTDTSGKPVDFGSQVQEGATLARIDDSLYRMDVQQAAAELKRAEAELIQLRARAKQAEQDWKRAETLGPSDALSRSAYDSYRAAFDAATASAEVGVAQMAQAQAALAKAERNLNFTVIRSPVSGVVIDKKVNVGQTVVSSLNAPSLFLLAKDLSRMELWVSVNEADIGRIFPGQEVTFRVDAIPQEEFRGIVQKIRLNASMTQNVVTYIVEVAADNKSGKLLPYLTANVRFLVKRAENVLTVPAQSLNWAPKGQTQEGSSVWILERGEPKEIRVTVGVSNGDRFEVAASELKEGQAVIVSQIEQTKGGETNPFAPKIPGGRRMQ